MRRLTNLLSNSLEVTNCNDTVFRKECFHTIIKVRKDVKLTAFKILIQFWLENTIETATRGLARCFLVDELANVLSTESIGLESTLGVGDNLSFSGVEVGVTLGETFETFRVGSESGDGLAGFLQAITEMAMLIDRVLFTEKRDLVLVFGRKVLCMSGL